MAVNRGKQFEEVVKRSFLKVDGVSIDRLHDQTTGYRGSQNICDYIVYKKPYEYYIECKSVHGNTFSIHSNPKKGKDGQLHGFYGNITDTQWNGLLEKSKIKGVHAGLLVWFIDRDVTLYIPIQILQEYYRCGHKSIRYDIPVSSLVIAIKGTKKRVFFDYDMTSFFRRF